MNLNLKKEKSVKENEILAPCSFGTKGNRELLDVYAQTSSDPKLKAMFIDMKSMEVSDE